RERKRVYPALVHCSMAGRCTARVSVSELRAQLQVLI
ncbi:hypothetical protein ECARS42123_5009, partial [Escherichia coli ARS4.2123]